MNEKMVGALALHTLAHTITYRQQAEEISFITLLVYWRITQSGNFNPLPYTGLVNCLETGKLRIGAETRCSLSLNPDTPIFHRKKRQARFSYVCLIGG